MSSSDLQIPKFPDPQPFALNPHLEPHGHQGVEWSYHFPLQKNLVTQAELTIRFPAEKSPQSARDSAIHATIAHTRFSLAGAAADAAKLSQQLYKDSLWIRDRLCPDGTPHCGVKDLENSPILLRFGSNYFSMGFLSRLTLMLQSTLKHSGRGYIRKLEAMVQHPGTDTDTDTDSNAFSTLESTINIAFMAIESAIVWKGIRNTCRSHPEFQKTDAPSLLENFCDETREISELILGLTGKTLADAQDSTDRLLSKCLSENAPKELSDILTDRKTALIQHTSRLCDLRKEFMLPSIELISEDPEVAAKYYERSLEIKRSQYRKWELETHLKPGNKKLDFWIGTLAPVVAAIVSLFTKLTRERVKALFKVNLQRHINKKKGRWTGTCTFTPPKFEVDANAAQTASTPLRLERRLWWTREGDDWVFRIKEKFISEDTDSKLPSHTLKQIWRVPFDEIMTTIDDSTHVLKLPSLDGKPRQIRVLKRTSIPYTVNVFTQEILDKKSTIVEESKLHGLILLSGANITRVSALST
jgi:hypothetical protein